MKGPSPRAFLLSLCLAVFAACTDGYVVAAPAPARTVRPVSIQVEVYDPATNWVWENVLVRVVEAEQEWSQCVCTSPYEDWIPTDPNGLVFFSEHYLAGVGVGFLEDGVGRAVLGSRHFEDEATVWLEVWAPGFDSVFVAVDLCWCEPDAFVAAPFGG
jgi:hypothetical protein